ncbi:MAG TPA: DNA double-strand break repair nuclease NurA [Candidatus Bathyarchaeia archaeon]|nr:DNA double-strand break repair nuclease NurA [Candidatus Bathyarchaeia archaeon]
MIEQQSYPIENVPKYNFSDTFARGFGLPRELAQLCLSSLEELKRQQVKSNSIDENSEKSDIDSIAFLESATSPKLIQVQPLREDTEVAAVDVSSINLGETNNGVLVAIRGAIVWNVRFRFHYLRLGPFLFHLTEESGSRIFNLLRKYGFGFSQEISGTDVARIQTRIASMFEHRIQMDLCRLSSNSLILLDGSLVGGTPDAPEEIVAELLRTARTRVNTILAFSKSSKLYFKGHHLGDIANRYNPPCLVKIGCRLQPRIGPFRLFGDIYVANLSKGGVSFRLDVDKELEQSQAVDSVRRLLGNELVYQGYPETLRLAHIYSTFTANEVIAMQRYMMQQPGLQIVVRPNLRRLLFGPFGKGSEGY